MAAALTIVVFLTAVAAVSIGIMIRAGASKSGRVYARGLRVRVVVGVALFLVLVPLVTPALPIVPLSWFAPSVADAAETVNSPEFLSVAVMPNGQVGMLFLNNAGGGVTETRFKRYFAEYGAESSQQISTASPWYPQLATFQGKTIAAYVDTRNASLQLLFRVSLDSGASWGAEYTPFGAETFDSTKSAPLLTASRDGTKLYLFSAGASGRPQYRYTQDPTIATWTTPVDAGDASMSTITGAPCDSGECGRIHNLEFTELFSGQWIYVTGTPIDAEHWGCGRGTQVGTLGGAWTPQVFHGGACDLSGFGGHSRATTFVDRSGNVYYVRADWKGQALYYQKSTDGGLSWQPAVQAYANTLDQYTVGSPVGLYVPGYSRGEYIWYAGFGGVGLGNDQNAVRVIPLWTSAQAYAETATARIFGSLGGDYDFGTAYPYTFGRRDIPTGVGAYKTSAEDLGVAGRLLNLSVARSYNSDDLSISPLGPGWNLNFNWKLTDASSFVVVRRGDGRQDTFTSSGNGAYTAPTNVFDALTKNGDGTYTLTLKSQTQYEFSSTGKLTRIHEPAGNQIQLTYTAGKLSSITDTVGRTTRLNYTGGVNSALGKTYTESTAPNASYPDSGGGQLPPVDMAHTPPRNWSVAAGFGGQGFPCGWPTGCGDATIGNINDANDASAHGWLRADYPGSPSNYDGWGVRFTQGSGAQPFTITGFRVLMNGNQTGWVVQCGGTVLYTGGAWPGTLTDTGAISISPYTVSATQSCGLGYWGASGAGRQDLNSFELIGTAPGDGIELTDGVIGSATDFHDPAWQAHLDLSTPLDQTVDLGSVQALGAFRSFYYADAGQSIYRPASVETLTSADNVTYTSRGTTLSATAANVSGALWQYDLNITPVSARYVRFRIASGGTWTFSTETQIFLAGSTPLQPQTGTNGAATRTYQESVLPGASYPDTGGTELTNGTIGDPTNYGDASWQGHQNLGATTLDVTVDLGSAQRIGVTRSFHFQDPSVGIIKPAKIELLISLDNAQYTSRGATVAAASVNDTGSRWRYEFDLGGVSARWVRFRITTGGEWLFSSEVQAFAEGAAPLTLPITYGDRLASITDSAGRKVTYDYDQLGRLSRVVDKIGNASGQDPVLHSWHYSYDGQTQHIASVIDPDSRVRVANTYNTEGRLATQKDGAGNVSSFGYGTQQTTVTDPRGHVTTQNFDSRWRLTSQLDTVGANNYTLQYLYEDAAQNLTATIDRNGNRTDYTYDARGNVLTKTDPQVPPAPRYVTGYQYDSKNNLTQVTDARSFVTTNTYDATTNVKLATVQQITAGPATYATTKWEYADAANPGLPTKIISPRGNTTGTPNYTYSQSLSYDAQGNLIQRLDADANKTTFGYDGLSRQTTMVDPDGYAPVLDTAHHTWTTVYDENDRVTEVRDPLIHSTFTAYDGAGNRTSATDRDGNISTYAYDGAARLLNTKQKPDPLGQPGLVYTTSVVRDGNGNATSVSQDKQGAGGTATVTTDYAYDALNRMTSFTSHPTGVLNLTTSYVLDGNGNATKRTTADAVDTNYQYDAMSRLTQVSATGITTITYGYDELSRRTSMGDGIGSSTYTYDGLGRLAQAVQPNGTLGYGYDLDSNRTTLTYPTVGSVTYVFSPAGRLSSLTDWGSRQSNYTYFASGLAKTLTVPGGMTTTYTYDYAQRLATLVNSTAGGTITSDTYTVDNEGNRTAIDELMPAVLAASAKVNSDAGTAIQDHPAIALGNESPNPASYLIWDDQRDGATDSNIYFSRRDPVTGTWSANVKVNTDTGTRIQANPAIAADSSGNAYAVWDDFRDGTSNQNIYARKRSAAGVWDAGADKKVNDGTGNTNERNPRIAGTPAGAETAVWVDLRSSQLNIYSSTLAAGGSTWSTPNLKVTDNSTSSVAKDFPDVAVDAAGTSYAVWQDSRNGNADIFFSSLASGGSAWAANVKISDDPGTTAQTRARIGTDSAGNLTAAWIDARTSPAHVRVARRPFGGAWSASIDITPSPANVQSLALSVRSDGFTWAVWGDTRAGATNQDIWGSRYDPALNTWSTPVRLDDDPGTTANQSSPAVAFGPAETMLAWRDNRLSANGDIQARRVQVIAGMSDHFALGYDGLNRLTKIAGPVAETFALDGASNITSRTGPTQTDAYDLANRLTSDGSQSFTWSNADRLTNRGADLFGYDALDRLISSTVAGTARTYAYNGDGLLQSRTGSGATTFLWDPATSPSRELKQGSDNIIYGLGPLYVVKADGTTLTFARDGSKNVRAELSSAGAVTAAFRYRSYGQLAQSTNTGPTYLGLASQLLDLSGLYYMRARWYDPASARFLTRDPMSGDPKSPSTLNAFGYAAGEPMSISDPSGMCLPWCVTIGVGAAIGGVTSWLAYQTTCQQSSAGCTVAGAAGATAAGALTGALIGLAGPAAGSLVAAIGITGGTTLSAAVTAGAAITMRAGIGASGYFIGGEVTNVIDALQNRTLEFSPDAGEMFGAAAGAAIAGTLIEAALPLRGVNRLSQGQFMPQSVLSSGANAESFYAAAVAGTIFELLGAATHSQLPTGSTEYDFSGAYFSQ